MPDLLVDWHDYKYSLATAFSTGPLVSSTLDSTAFKWAPCGYHRPNGIFLAYGPGIRRGARVEGKVMDATATVLYEMGMAVPAEMDGRVITGAYEPSRLESDPPRTSDLDTTSSPESADVYTADEEAEVSKRLKELGYLG